MPASAALRRRHVLASVVTSSLILFAAAPAHAQAVAEAPAAAVARTNPPLSAASGVLMVEPSAGVSDAQFQRWVQTHVATIGSEHHLRRTVDDPNRELRKTKWFAASNDPVERAAWLRDHLRVAAVRGTSLIEVALPDVTDADGRKAILQEVGQAYLESQDRSGKQALFDRTAMLNSLKQKVDVRLSAVAAELASRQVQFQADGGGGGAGGIRLGVKEIELSRLVQEQGDASAKATKAAADAEAIAVAIKEGKPLPGGRPIGQGAAGIQANEDQRIQQMEVEAALAREQFGENNPKYLGLAKRLELMRASYKERVEAARAKARAAQLEDAQAEAEAARAKVEAMKRRVEQLKAEIGDLNNTMQAYLQLKAEEKALREQRRTLQEQIDKVLASVSTAGGGAAPDIHWHLRPEAAPAH